MVLIKSANDQMPVRKAGGYRTWVEQMVLSRWQRRVQWGDIGGRVGAEVVRSSWRVSCPFCAGAIVVNEGDLFFCPDCVMQGNSFKAMVVVFPKHRAEIENVLLKRPDPVHRNWLIGETVEDLRAENRAHGIEV